MSHQVIPSHWRVKRSTPFFTKDNVPTALLTHHNTATGIFGQICVMQGVVTFYGFASEEATEPEKTIVIKAGEFAYEDLLNRAQGLMQTVEQAFLRSHLPDAPDLQQLSRVLVTLRQAFYRQ